MYKSTGLSCTINGLWKLAEKDCITMTCLEPWRGNPNVLIEGDEDYSQTCSEDGETTALFSFFC